MRDYGKVYTRFWLKSKMFLSQVTQQRFTGTVFYLHAHIVICLAAFDCRLVTLLLT